MNPHYFGKSEHPLFGVYHPARKSANSSKAVLLCPPIAHEHIRTHWSLRLLSQRLSREGFHSMRFDYTGIGDSSNWMGGVGSIDQWLDDVCLAAEDLMAESGCQRLSIVGLRMGAALATLAAQRGLPIDHLVLWDPVVKGADYLSQLSAMHQQMLDLWVCPMTTEDSNDGKELLGFYYQRSLLDEITEIDLLSERPECGDLTVIDCAEAPGSSALVNSSGSASRMITVDDVSDWGQLAEIETAWLQSQAPTRVIETLKSPIPEPTATPVVGAAVAPTVASPMVQA